MRLSQEEVNPNPGSWVKTPWSRAMVPMSRTSGPIVPVLTGKRLFLPLAGLISSKFLSAMAAILGVDRRSLHAPGSECTGGLFDDLDVFPHRQRLVRVDRVDQFQLFLLVLLRRDAL